MTPSSDMSPEQLAKLERIQEQTPPPSESKDAGIQEAKALQEKLKRERLSTQNEGLKQDIEERKKYAEKSFKLVSLWIFGVFLILLFQGFLSERTTFCANCLSFGLQFKLSDSVLLAVVRGGPLKLDHWLR
jgi:hypothetical protein